MPAYLISATVIGVLAQRLVRTLCRQCRTPDAQAPRSVLEAVVKPWKVTAAGTRTGRWAAWTAA